MNQNIFLRVVRLILLLLLSVAIFAFSSEILASPIPQLIAQTNTGSQVETTDPMQVQPEESPPTWAPTIDPQMLAVVEELLAFPQGGNWHPGNAPSQALEWAVQGLAKAGTLSIISVYPREQ